MKNTILKLTAYLAPVIYYLIYLKYYKVIRTLPAFSEFHFYLLIFIMVFIAIIQAFISFFMTYVSIRKDRSRLDALLIAIPIVSIFALVFSNKAYINISLGQPSILIFFLATYILNVIIILRKSKVEKATQTKDEDIKEENFVNSSR